MKLRSMTLAVLLCLLINCIAITSCAKKEEKFSAYSFEYFDTVTTVSGYAKSQAEFDAASAEILAELGEYHKLFTIYHRFDGMENLCTINELVNGQHRTVTVDKRIIDMLLFAKDMYELTDGRVNIAMGSVLSIWHDYRNEGIKDPAAAKLPPMEKLEAAAEHTDIDCIVIDEENLTVTITDPAMKLDVGAVAKGYAVEMVAKTMEKKALSGYILNVGGNVRAVGEKPDGEGWTVGIEDPAEEVDYVAYLALKNESLVTSGSYQRYYLVNGKRYHHIIDPDTLMPANRYMSVSVLTSDSGMADALSTALFCMTLDEGRALVDSLPEVEAQWIDLNGVRHTTSGWKNYTVEI